MSALSVYGTMFVEQGKTSSESKHGTLLFTATSDTDIKTALAEHPIPLGDRTNCLVIMKHIGSNAPASGNSFNFGFFIVVDSVFKGSFLTYRTQQVAPDSMNYTESTNTGNSSKYTVNSDNNLTSNSNSNTYLIPAGNSIYYVVIPLDLSGIITLDPF